MPTAKNTQEIRVQSLGQKDPLEKEVATHSVFLPGKSHGQRSLAGYSPWGHKENDMIERLILLTIKLIRTCNSWHGKGLDWKGIQEVQWLG